MRVTIVGAGGGVGSSIAYNLLLRPEEFAVDLVDARAHMAVSHEMDLQQVLAAGARGRVRIVPPEEIAAADVVVLSAAVPITVNTSRMVYLRDNARILDEVVTALGEPAAWPGVLVVVTNPVDPLVTRLVASGFDRRRVIGYTVNDTLRLRTAIGELLGVPPADVEAWVLGEHGDACVPLLDRVSVRGEPVELSADERREAAAFLRGWYARHVALDSGRSSTWTSGLNVARLVAELEEPRPDPWPASVVLDGEYGVAGVALTVPAVLGHRGVAGVREWPLSDEQRAAMRSAAAVVSDAVAAVPAASGPPALP